MSIARFIRQTALTLTPGVVFCFHSTPRRAGVWTAFTAAALFGVPLHAAGLNDTGQTLCYDGAGTVPCTAPAADDGRYGRDAAATAGVLTKTGAGAAGFDFTKIPRNGTVLGAGAHLYPGTAATDWACTRDNVTDLTWEVKTGVEAHLSYYNHSYTWYNTNGAENGGYAGSVGANTCNATLPSSQCNTQAFVAAVNAAALCGYSDWRLPTPREMKTIVYYGVGRPYIDPSIDTTYFPYTIAEAFWSASTFVVDPANAWYLGFSSGNVGPHGKTNRLYLQLVRGEQF